MHTDLVRESIRKAWHLLQKNVKYGKLFSQPPKFVYRKSKCLANCLVKSDIKEKTRNVLSTTNQKGTFPCMGCLSCSSIIKGPVIHHPTRGVAIPACGYFTCNSGNVMYMLKCPCGRAYVGITSRMVQIRLNEHKSNTGLFKGYLLPRTGTL